MNKSQELTSFSYSLLLGQFQLKYFTVERTAKTLHRMSPCTPVSVLAKITWMKNAVSYKRELTVYIFWKLSVCQWHQIRKCTKENFRQPVRWNSSYLLIKECYQLHENSTLTIIIFESTWYQRQNLHLFKILCDNLLRGIYHSNSERSTWNKGVVAFQMNFHVQVIG